MGDEVEKPTVIQYVEAISVKPPQFNSDNIRGWFVGLECSFGISKVTSGVTKTLHLLHTVPAKIIESVPEIDLYKSTFAEEDYEKYKAALIRRFSQTTWQKLDCLFDPSPDVAKKPSELYYQLQKWAKDPDIDISDTVLAHVWFKKLSAYVQNHMMGEMDTFSFEDDLETADRFYAHELQGNHSAAIIEPQQVLVVSKRSPPARPSTLPRQQTSRPASTGFKEDGRWCYFHFHYGNRAQKCREGCKYLLDRPENARQ